MYKILGGDQKEYGPVTAETLREWIAQGRASATTKARDENTGEWRALSAFEEIAPLFAAPSTPPPMPDSAASAMAAVIPYKNPKALIAYYLGVFSLIPCIGVPLGIAAVILGILGLKFAGTNPTARGKVHAWVGIILGGLCALAYTLIPLLIILSKR